MRIAFHCQSLTHEILPGIGYYVLNLIHALLKRDEQNEYQFIASRPLLHAPHHPRFCPNLVRPALGLSYIGFPLACHRSKCDLAFLPKETVPPFLTIPTVITVYDLFSFSSRELPLSSQMHFWMAKRFHLKRAAKILAISEDTKRDLIHLFDIPEERIAVTPLGVDVEHFYPRSQEEIHQALASYGITPPYFINTSSWWWSRKNLIRLIQAFTLFKRRTKLPHQLVITGRPGPSYAEMKGLIEQVKLDVKLLQFVPYPVLPALLSGAEALVFPSLHEGFGLPLLEAMACQCPVITSDCSALREVAADAALLVDPYEVESIAAAMQDLARHRDALIVRGNGRVKQYSWDNTALRTLEAFQTCH